MTAIMTRTVLIPTYGVRLHAEVCGPHSGELVVLLHGFPDHWYGWVNQIGPLSQSGLLVVAPDQRGYNLSDKPRGVAQYDVELLSRDVLGILDYYGRERAIIVGHDWGGLVAWQLAMRHPDRISKLAVMNAPHPAAYTSLLMEPRSGQMLRSWYTYAFQPPYLVEAIIRATGYRALRRAVQSTARPGSITREMLARYEEAWRQPGALTAMINWYRAAVRRALRKGPDAYREAVQARVTVPTLILWGEKDPALASELGPLSAGWCDDVELVRFPNASHWLQHDEPGRVTSRLLTFMV